MAGLKIFCILEIVLLITSNELSLVNWNQNVFSMRIATSGLIGFCLYRNFAIRLIFILLALYLPISANCRTATVATVISLGTFVFFCSGSANRKIYVFLAILVFVLGSLMLGSPGNELEKIVKTYRRSSNPIAVFFLHDKQREDQNDLLDRKEQWDRALKTIYKFPFFGIGLGNEDKYFDHRAHNSFLSAATECGIPYAIAWLVFSIQILLLAIRQPPPREQDSGSRLSSVLWLLIVYLMLASIVSTSGLGSIFTPASQVVYLLAVWVTTRNV